MEGGVKPCRRINRVKTGGMRFLSLKSLGRNLSSAAIGMCMLCGAQAQAGTSILIDAGSGRVLSEENALQRWYPASLTKLMTAYIAFKALKSGQLTITSPVKISANAAKQPPSRMGYKPGQVLNLDNALKIMLVKSANDIAVAVAETAGGKNYQKAMNDEALRLGMTESNWVNANGLHSTQNYTTARDLALLSMALRRDYPEYASYFGIEAIQYDDKLERNYNILLGRFDGADGMKTGFVCASGFNLVASATRNGRTLVAVVLGETSQQGRAEKAADLLAKGFASDGSVGASIGTLQPAPGAAKSAKDMRAIVCAKGAEADRWDGREVEGRMTFNSPHIKAMLRAPNAVPVGLGGATGPSIAANDNDAFANVPIPTPRPNYVPAEIMPLALTGEAKLRKSMALPQAGSN
jgi:D-alanyl-D-alanine carboxypeptidase